MKLVFEVGRTMCLYRNGVTNRVAMIKIAGSKNSKLFSSWVSSPILKSSIATINVTRIRKLQKVFIVDDNM